jgi:hypothetical protein
MADNESGPTTRIEVSGTRIKYRLDFYWPSRIKASGRPLKVCQWTANRQSETRDLVAYRVKVSRRSARNRAVDTRAPCPGEVDKWKPIGFGHC